MLLSVSNKKMLFQCSLSIGGGFIVGSRLPARIFTKIPIGHMLNDVVLFYYNYQNALRTHCQIKSLSFWSIGNQSFTLVAS